MRTFHGKRKDFDDGSVGRISAEVSGEETLVGALLTERIVEGLLVLKFSTEKKGFMALDLAGNKVRQIPSVPLTSAAENPVEISMGEWELWQEFLELLKKRRPLEKHDGKINAFQIPFDQIPKKKRSKKSRTRRLTCGTLVVPCAQNPLQMSMEERQVGVQKLQKPDQKEQWDTKTSQKRKPENPANKDKENDEKPKKQRKIQHNPIPTEDLPASFRTRVKQMGGTNPILVVQKQLYKSDIDPDQNRFLIPPMQMNRDFLTRDESQLLEKYHRNKYSEGDMRVVILEPSLETSTLSLRVWDVNSKLTHVLVKDWKLIVKRNGLEVGDIVQLWSFRVRPQLCFALLTVGPAQSRTDM